MSDEELVFKEKLDFLFNVINRYDHYIGTTNFKVGLMMSFVGAVVLGLTMRVMLIAAPKEECGVLYYFAIFSSLSTIVLSLLAAVNLLRVVFPNTNTHGGKKSLIFFGDVASYENGSSGYAAKIKDASLDILIEDLSKQAFVVAEVAKEKFRILKIAVIIIVWGVIPLLSISIIFLMLEGVD